MQFTLVFDSHEGENLSYMLCFIPCPIWKKGDKELLNIHPEYPHFRVGDIEKLIQKERLEKIKRVILIIHKTGHATIKDLENILLEMKSLGISYDKITL